MQSPLPFDAITAAHAAAEEQNLELLQKLIIAGKEGKEAIDHLIEAAMEDAGCEVERLDYQPADVPLVDEFAAEQIASPSKERCLIGR
ncbi:MAG: hypothetical protein ACR2QF_01055, partial [Geminicoccaceae bacterium]